MTAPSLVQHVVGHMDVSVPDLSTTPVPGNVILMWKTRTAGYPTLHTGFTDITTCHHYGGNTRYGRMAYRVVEVGDTVSSYSGLDADSSSVAISEWVGTYGSFQVSDWNGVANHANEQFWNGGNNGGVMDGVRFPAELVTPTAGTDAAIITGASVGQGSNEADISAITPISGTTELDENLLAGTTTPNLWIGYRIITGASGSYGVGATAASDSRGIFYSGVSVILYGINQVNAEVATGIGAAHGASTAGPGVWVEWQGSFVQVPVAEWTITRGASAELTGGSQPGTATILLINTPSDAYNPENAGGPYDGVLHDGPRVWIGVNDDGTVDLYGGKTIHGLHAGRITDLSVLPVPGASVAPFVEIVTADPLEWASRQKVTLADSRTRSQADLRSDVLDELGWTLRTVPSEPTTLPLSSADGLALNILDALNTSNGTRHFAKPEDTAADWFRYVAVRRTDRLDGTSDASLSASSQHVTSTSGWRVSADGVINQQRASVEPIDFPLGLGIVWETETIPLVVVTGSPLVVWTEFDDYVADPELDINYTGSALTQSIVPFGHTAKVTLTSAGTSTLSVFRVKGYHVVRQATASVVIDDLTSQAEPRGVRAGPDLSGDFLGTLTSAEGMARHIVWRFGDNQYRPTLTVENWLPTQFSLDLFDRIAITSTQLGVTARIFEIVGLTHHCILAAATGAVHHVVTYTLQESRVQTATSWMTWDSTVWDDASEPWAY